MGRKIWFVGLLALLLFTLAGAGGLRVEVDSDGFRWHLLLGLGSSLLAVFAHGWVVVYLLLTGRLLRRTLGAPAAGPHRVVARRSRWAWPLALAAALGSLGVLAGSAPVYTGRLSAAAHQGMFWGALALQLAALAAEWRALGLHERLIRATDGRLGAAR